MRGIKQGRRTEGDDDDDDQQSSEEMMAQVGKQKVRSDNDKGNFVISKMGLTGGHFIRIYVKKCRQESMTVEIHSL